MKFTALWKYRDILSPVGMLIEGSVPLGFVVPTDAGPWRSMDRVMADIGERCKTPAEARALVEQHAGVTAPDPSRDCAESDARHVWHGLGWLPATEGTVIERSVCARCGTVRKETFALPKFTRVKLTYDYPSIFDPRRTEPA